VDGRLIVDNGRRGNDLGVTRWTLYIKEYGDTSTDGYSASRCLCDV